VSICSRWSDGAIGIRITPEVACHFDFGGADTGKWAGLWCFALFGLGEAIAVTGSLELRALLEDFEADPNVDDQSCQNANPYRGIVRIDS